MLGREGDKSLPSTRDRGTPRMLYGSLGTLREIVEIPRGYLGSTLPFSLSSHGEEENLRVPFGYLTT